ncbi:hypothetical protein SLA2020_244440 [Shorea laevis]
MFLCFFFFDGQSGMVNEDFASNWMGRFLRIICVLKNGEIVLECNKGALISYDPKTDRFNRCKYQQAPAAFPSFCFLTYSVLSKGNR